MSPYVLASDRSFYWVSVAKPRADFFDFVEEGSGALLLLAVHLCDPMPWLAARHALCFEQKAGIIDKESKRILGKRFCEEKAASPTVHRHVLDPILLLTERLAASKYDFLRTDIPTSLFVKQPGKLLPRKLQASVSVCYKGGTFELHSRNFSEISQCLHAELCVLLELSRRLSVMDEPPLWLESFHLKTTLKPCRMCAAFLHITRSRCHKFSVTYEEEDPGRLAQNTLLDRWGYES
ncbi:MAG: Bd3614 family nucleic acid deaminase [Oligoflexus sp.]